MGLNEELALLNATLTFVGVIFMSAGYLAIRRRQIRRHRACMLAAFATSLLFLVSFVARFVRFGAKPFHGEGAVRVFYYVIWFSHEPLAVVNVLLVLTALGFALRRKFETHRELARFALPIWLYVSVTGLVLFVLLYLR